MQCRWGADGMNYINLHPFFVILQADRRSSVSLDNTKQAAIHTLASITCAAKNMNSGLLIVCVMLSSGTLNLLLFVKPVCESFIVLHSLGLNVVLLLMLNQ